MDAREKVLWTLKKVEENKYPIVVRDDGIRVIEEMSMTIQVQAMETFDEFIFQTIEPYCEQVMQRKISKKVLEQALTEYFENHPQNQD